MNPEFHSIVLNCERILPPFLGELGYEVKYFVGLVEPWLRSGWKLISKRPELYPKDTTVSCPELFEEINKLKVKYSAQEVHSNLCVLFENRSTMNRTDYETVKRKFEFELRETLRPHISSPCRPITIFDTLLTSSWSGINEFFLSSYHGLRPSYLPDAFSSGPQLCPPHIGVQFRNVSSKDEIRNTNWQLSFPTLAELSIELALPLYVYGEPTGCFFPPSCVKASSFHNSDYSGLAGDLACLRSCRIIFSPDSGWTDLMAWLRIPCLILRLHNNFTYLSALSFDAKIDLYDNSQPILKQAINILLKKYRHVNLVNGSTEPGHLIPSLFDLDTLWKR